MTTPERSACPGCGVDLPARPGPTHRYLESTPACWEKFGELLAREFGDPTYWPPHPLTVDAYAAQHPGVQGSQTTHSAAFHLVGLCLVVERGVDLLYAARMRRRAEGFPETLPWLEPPVPLGPITVLDVLRATTGEEHARRVREWAGSVWEAWSVHHETVRAWTDRL